MSEEDIDRQIEGMRQHQGTLVDAPADAEVKKDDFVTLNFEGFVDGEHYLRGPFLRGRAYSRLLVVLYHVPSLFADAGVAVLLLVARSVVNLAHHECHHERVNAGNGAACVVSGDGDGRS